MIAIKVFRQGEPIFSVRSEKKRIEIGRGPQCEVALHDQTLSRIHCVLSFKDGVWYLEDESKNGIRADRVGSTKSENSEISSREDEAASPRLPSRMKIEGPLRFRLGRLYTLEVDPKGAADKSLADQKTVLTSQSPTKVFSIDPNSDQLEIGQACLKVNLSDGKIIQRTLESQGLSIGAHESNDLTLNSDRVSKFHARIDYTESNEYILSDLNSTNGTLLNGVRITRAALPENAEIEIGGLKLEFEIQKKKVELKPVEANQFMDMVSVHPKMKRVFSMVEALSGSDAPVFIRGETGTGKELLAKAVHTLSRRFRQPFIALNCAAFPKDLVESELFGHEKGAFTGATQTRIGAFEAAHGGTLFLDEVAELEKDVQAKLLRTLETGQIKRVGSNQMIQTSVRIVSATHQDLDKAVQEGKFRQDLYFRLHVIPIELPALRYRIDDLDLLVPHFLKLLGSSFQVDADAMRVLKDYKFPGNIRELRNILERAIVEAELSPTSALKKVLTKHHFKFIDRLPTLSLGAMSDKDRIEAENIIQVLKENDFNQSKSSKILNIPVSTLNDRIRRLGIYDLLKREKNQEQERA